MIRAVVSAHVSAPADRVRALYEDFGRWARLFPATIRGTRLVRREGGTTVVEVDHLEGKVLNVLRRVSANRIDLQEFKRRFDATFTNEFVPEGDGMRFTLTAAVRLKWPFRVLAPFVKPLVIARMRRHVLEPLKAAAESERRPWNAPSMVQLPFVDEHRQRIDAPADVVWTALLKVLHREMGGSARIARLLGCDPAQGTAEFGGRPGEAVPGFRVVEAEPGRRLALRGRHRFSDYALTFVLDGGRLRAQTHAAFSGVLGRLYRTAVIGSGGHRLVTRRLLREVARAT